MNEVPSRTTGSAWRVVQHDANSRPSVDVHVYPTRDAAMALLHAVQLFANVERIVETEYGYAVHTRIGISHYWVVWVNGTMAQRSASTPRGR